MKKFLQVVLVACLLTVAFSIPIPTHLSAVEQEESKDMNSTRVEEEAAFKREIEEYTSGEQPPPETAAEFKREIEAVTEKASGWQPALKGDVEFRRGVEREAEGSNGQQPALEAQVKCKRAIEGEAPTSDSNEFIGQQLMGQQPTPNEFMRELEGDAELKNGQQPALEAQVKCKRAIEGNYIEWGSGKQPALEFKREIGGGTEKGSGLPLECEMQADGGCLEKREARAEKIPLEENGIEEEKTHG